MADNFEYVRDSLINDVKTLKSKDGFLYAGFPRFMELFGRDSLISSMELSYLYPQILKNTLIALSKKQGTQYNNNSLISIYSGYRNFCGFAHTEKCRYNICGIYLEKG